MGLVYFELLVSMKSYYDKKKFYVFLIIKGKKKYFKIIF